MLKIKRILGKLIFPLFFTLLVYTRFIGLDWGLPYPMHPDERNMANAIQNLSCDSDSTGSKFKIQNCFDPHFYAYGQFPLYLGYGIVYLMKFFDGDLITPVSFEEAVLSLRVISAVASILNVLILVKLAELLILNFIFSKNQYLNNKNLDLNQNFKFKIINLLVFTFSPFFIQFSHFGTTESLLMFLYSLIIYLTLLFALEKIPPSIFYFLTSITAGIAIGSKVSSVLFLIVPGALILEKSDNKILKSLLNLTYLIALTLIFSIVTSPHNFINFNYFLGAMKYESEVALGTYRAFYTRSFEFAVPLIFQVQKIFPYALGWPAFVLFVLGFIFLPFKREFNILRLAILAGFLPNALMYAKWTRFVSPILPLMLALSIIFIYIFYLKVYSWIKSKLQLKSQNFLTLICNFAFLLLIFALLINGIAYLNIYQNPDVRFTASEWVYKNIRENSYILSETANVVDVPVKNPKQYNNKTVEQPYNINYISFNFYDLEENPLLKSQLWEHIVKADYIFIPSRRVFKNHYCPSSSIQIDYSFEAERCRYLKAEYSTLNEYYEKLYSGELGFQKVAEFSSYPKLELFGKTIVEFPDEEAEETWTVFDHPVFRIYKRN